MVATKIFKKCSPNGRLYLYLGQREYISCDNQIDDIKGIAYLPEVSDLQGILNSITLHHFDAINITFFAGKFIFASLVVTFRHGREEDEMMGVSFKKELVVDRVQVHPADSGNDNSRTKLQVSHYLVLRSGFTYLHKLA